MPPKSQTLFSVEDDIKLAELVSKHPSVYDLKHKFYKNLGVKENAWTQIAEEMEKNVDDCKRRWKNIKDTYNKNRRQRKLGTGSSAKNKPSKWALTDILSFLDVVSYEREGLSNIPPITTTIASEDINSEEENDILVDDEDSQMDLNIESLQSTSQIEMETDRGETGDSRLAKRKLSNEKTQNKKTQKEDLAALFSKSMEQRQKMFLALNDDEEDPIDTFFKSMAQTVKTFNPNLKIKAKTEIFNIVTKLELENINPPISTLSQNYQVPFESSSYIPAQAKSQHFFWPTENPSYPTAQTGFFGPNYTYNPPPPQNIVPDTQSQFGENIERQDN